MSSQLKSIVYMLLALSLALTVACNLTSALSGGGEDDQGEQPVATLPQQPEPTEPVVPPQKAFTQFTYRGIELEYDPALVTNVTGQIRVGLACDSLSPIPPHITLQIDLPIDFRNAYEPTISVFHVQDYIDFCDESESPLGSSSVWVNETLDALKGAIASQSGDVSVPPLPMVNAGEPLHERGQYLPFQNGAGVRAIVEYAQDMWFFNNYSISYNFQGLTTDGEYYITGRFPVFAPFLIDGSEPSENSNEHAIPIPEYDVTDFDTFIQVVEDYNGEARRLFGVRTDAEFIPDLRALDAIIASLLVAPVTVDITGITPFEAAHEGDHYFQVTTTYSDCGDIVPGEYVTYPRITLEFEGTGLTVSGENPESGRHFIDQYIKLAENSYEFLHTESSVCEGANGTMIFSSSGITTSFQCGSETCFTQQWVIENN